MTRGKSLIASLLLLCGAGFCLGVTFAYRHLFFRIMEASENSQAIPNTNLMISAPTAFGWFAAGLLVLIAILVPIGAFLKKK